MAGGRSGELLLPGELQLYRPPQPQHGQRHHVLGQHFLLAAEPAADPGGHDAHAAGRQAEEPADRVPGEERCLGTGPEHQLLVLQPADRGVRLQGRVLDAVNAEAEADHRRRAGQARRDVADMAVGLRGKVTPRVGDPGGGCLVPVHERGTRRHGLVRIENGGPRPVLDGDPGRAQLRRGGRFGHHGGYPLAGEAHHPVEQQSVERIVGDLLVPGAGIGHCGRIPVAEHRQHARDGQRRGGVHRHDFRVRMRGADQHHVCQTGNSQVQRVRLVAGDHVAAGWGGQAGPGRGGRGRSGRGRLGLLARFRRAARQPGERVGHGLVAGTAAQVALQRPGRIGPLLVVQSRDCHDHPGRAEAALESLRVQERLLGRVQFAIAARQALDRGHRLAHRAHRRIDAAVYGHPADVHGTGAAVAGVAPLLDPEPALLTQEGAQALPGRGRRARRHAIDDHDRASSSRTSRASCRVIASRQAGAPCTSSW